MKKYKHFSHEERIILQTHLDDGKLKNGIAMKMKCSPFAIRREIKRLLVLFIKNHILILPACSLPRCL